MEIQKIDLMKKKGFDISKVSNEKDMYATYIETYGTLRDVITECAKSLIFIDEFIELSESDSDSEDSYSQSEMISKDNDEPKIEFIIQENENKYFYFYFEILHFSLGHHQSLIFIK